MIPSLLVPGSLRDPPILTKKDALRCLKGALGPWLRRTLQKHYFFFTAAYYTVKSPLSSAFLHVSKRRRLRMHVLSIEHKCAILFSMVVWRRNRSGPRLRHSMAAFERSAALRSTAQLDNRGADLQFFFCRIPVAFASFAGMYKIALFMQESSAHLYRFWGLGQEESRFLSAFMFRREPSLPVKS